jgi:hypothetical protein
MRTKLAPRLGVKRQTAGARPRERSIDLDIFILCRALDRRIAARKHCREIVDVQHSLLRRRRADPARAGHVRGGLGRDFDGGMTRIREQQQSCERDDHAQPGSAFVKIVHPASLPKHSGRYHAKPENWSSWTGRNCDLADGRADLAFTAAADWRGDRDSRC